MIAAMQKADSTDPAKYLPELQKIKYNGATGVIEFDEKGDRKNAEITIFTLKDGKVTPVGVVKARQGAVVRRLHEGNEDGGGTGTGSRCGPGHGARACPGYTAGPRAGSAEEVIARGCDKETASFRRRFLFVGALEIERGLRQNPAHSAVADTGDGLDTFLQQMINGLTLGSVYAIVALGYTMVYGIIQLINFAHGEVVMIGAMVAYTVIVALTGANTGLPADRHRAGRTRSPRFPSAWRSATRSSASPTGRCAARRAWRRSSRPSACRSSCSTSR